MNKFTNPLDNVRIASPCSANWDEMLGDERKRFCGQCKLNVYNLSGMTRTEAENLLLTSEGRVCVRFYRRTDGSVLTKDCPVGWRAIKRRVSRTATTLVSLCAGIFTGLFAFNQTQTETDAVAVASPVKSAAPPPSFTQATKRLDGDDINDSFIGKTAVMGDMDLMPIAGEPINLDEVRTNIKKKRGR